MGRPEETMVIVPAHGAKSSVRGRVAKGTRIELVGRSTYTDLVQGPYDLVGDVHGMIRTFDAMLERLGYRRARGRWTHPQGRVLVSLGDLLDRGPDPLGCVERLAELVADGCGMMVLGNHELNALHYMDGLRERSRKNREQFATTLAQIEADPARWDRARAFIESQPTHALLDEDRLRVIHAHWDPGAVAALPTRLDGREALESSSANGALGELFELCIKGPERRCEPYQDANGHWRDTRRLAWWNEYPQDAPKIVFGHYWFPWRRGTPTQPGWTGPGRNAACLDFAAGRGGPLVALRYPEDEFVSVANLDRPIV